jgi:hypothetical protein
MAAVCPHLPTGVCAMCPCNVSRQLPREDIKQNGAHMALTGPLPTGTQPTSGHTREWTSMYSLTVQP